MNKQMEAIIIKPVEEQQLDDLRMTIKLLTQSKKALTCYKFGEEVKELKEIESIISKLKRRIRQIERVIRTRKERPRREI